MPLPEAPAETPEPRGPRLAVPKSVQTAAAAASEALRSALRVAGFRAKMARMQQEAAEKAAAAAETPDPDTAEAAEGRHDPEMTADPVSEGQDTPEASEPAVCAICQKVLTARDRAYVGEKNGNLCKRCNGYGQRRALKGVYANLAHNPAKSPILPASPPPPNPFFGDNRGTRRTAARSERLADHHDRVAARAQLRQSGAHLPPVGPTSRPFAKVTKAQRRYAKAGLEAQLKGEKPESLPEHLRPPTPPARPYGRQAQSTRKRKSAARRVVRPAAHGARKAA